MTVKTRRRNGRAAILAGSALAAVLFATVPPASAASGSAGSAGSAPANLHVVSETFTDLNLAWDAPGPAGSGVYYELFVDNNAYPKYPLQTPSVDVQLGATFGLTPGSTHTFQVEAFGGGKSFSDKLTVTLGPGDTTAPTAPADLHVVSTNANGVTLGWDASSDPDSPDITYFVYSPCGVTTTSTQATIPSQTANPVCGIPAGSTFTIQIFARDPSSNQSPLSNPVTFTFTG